MNDLNVIDTFLQLFIRYIDAGFGLLGPDVRFLSATLIGIDITLAGLFWSLGGDSDVLGRLLRKILYVGAFAWIITSFSRLGDIIFRSFAQAGLTAGGGTLSSADLLKPGRLAGTGFSAAWPLLQQASQLMGFTSFFDNFLTIAVLLFAWALVIVAFFILAVQMFVTIVEFKLTTLAGFILVPFALWNRTGFLAERVLGNVVSSGIKVMVLAVIVGIGSNLFAQFATALQGQEPDIGQAMSLVLASLTLFGLGIFGPGSLPAWLPAHRSSGPERRSAPPPERPASLWSEAVPRSAALACWRAAPSARSVPAPGWARRPQPPTRSDRKPHPCRPSAQDLAESLGRPATLPAPVSQRRSALARRPKPVGPLPGPPSTRVARRPQTRARPGRRARRARHPPGLGSCAASRPAATTATSPCRRSRKAIAAVRPPTPTSAKRRIDPMLFKRAVQRYGRTPAPETPYQRAGQVWDERIGSARVQARSWRYLAVACLALDCGLSGALVWQSLQSRVTPYVVEVDQLGEARAVTPAEAGYRPTDPQIAWHLARFITNVRSISLDPVLMRENFLSAYDFATQRGALFLNDYARTADPFGKASDRTVSVQVTSVVRASDRSFQVKWTETDFDRGTRGGTSHWTAIVSVKVRPPTSAEALRKNPLGLYVDAIDWSRELEPPVAPASLVNAHVPADVPLGSPLDPNLARGNAPAAPTPESRP